MYDSLASLTGNGDCNTACIYRNLSIPKILEWLLFAVPSTLHSTHLFIITDQLWSSGGIISIMPSILQSLGDKLCVFSRCQALLVYQSSLALSQLEHDSIDHNLFKTFRQDTHRNSTCFRSTLTLNRIDSTSCSTLGH